MFYTYLDLVVVIEATRKHELGGVVFFRDAVTTFGEGGGALLWIFLSDCVPSSRSFEFVVARCVVVPGFFWGEFLDVFRNFF
jgi:hypothetical protein